jgi:hypothetical protein
MDLNRMGSGKELLKKMFRAGNLRKMGWSAEQQQEQADKHKNPHTPKSRPE